MEEETIIETTFAARTMSSLKVSLDTPKVSLDTPKVSLDTPKVYSTETSCPQ